MRRLTQAQMDSDNGRIYGRAPVPGAKFEVNGVFYDSKGYECTLPGQKPKPVSVEAPKQEREPTEEEVKIDQFRAYLDSVTRDEDKADLISWAKDNLDKTYHPNTGLAKLKEKMMADFVEALRAEASDKAEGETTEEAA